MANQEHVKLLKQGVVTWNAWRQRFPEVQPDFMGARLGNIDLRNANLIGARFCGTDLHEANLSGADLCSADLRHAILNNANLSNADLSRASLSDAVLNKTVLRDTRFYEISLHYTIFAQVDLCMVEGLDTIHHLAPSYIDIKTVRLPEGEIRTNFLRGAGFSDAFIDYLPSLLTTAIQYESCFISYVHQDEIFARRLYQDLQGKGVRCWFAPHDLRPGNYHFSRIDEAIHLHENTLLLLSEHAVNSSWVKHEVQIVLACEITQDRTILFPLRLDEAIMEAKADWANRLHESRHIGDFTHWQDCAIYQQRFTELLRNLKVKNT